MKLVLTHNREGYTHDQALNPMTVADLKELLEQYDDEDEIITYELTNTYCGWGSISDIHELDEML